MSVGIYRITNTANGKFYIGSSNNLSRRKKHHFAKLRLKKHHNHKLQSDFDRYGETVFEFIIIKRTSQADLIVEEQTLLSVHCGSVDCYNINPTANAAPSSGRPLSSKYSQIPTGKQYGDWTVTGPAVTDDKGNTRLECVCSCGATQTVSAYRLVREQSKQCKKCARGQTKSVAALSNKMLRSAGRAGVDYQLSTSQLSESFSNQRNTCSLTGQGITPTTATAVRWDNSSGYTLDNTVIVNANVGSVMNSAGIDAQTFIGLCQVVAENAPETSKNPVEDFFNRREKDE